jgi:hypothetical protein
MNLHAVIKIPDHIVQITGQPNMLYYAPTIFQLLGFKSSSAATLATVGLGLIKVCTTQYKISTDICYYYTESSK